MTLDIFPVPARDVEGSLRAEAGRIPFGLNVPNAAQRSWSAAHTAYELVFYGQILPLRATD